MQKQSILIILSLFCVIGLFAQESKIENTRLTLSSSNDSLIVNYDLLGQLPAFGVKLNITDSLGKPFQVKTVNGDMGDNIQPGLDKTIYWNMDADGFDIFNTKMLASVSCETYLKKQLKQKKDVWIPWLYIASGASAAGGVFAHFLANSYYDKSQTVSTTNSAEKYHANANLMDAVSYGAYGVAGGLAVVGVMVHIKHIRNNKELQIAYQPLVDGALMSLSYNF